MWQHVAGGDGLLPSVEMAVEFYKYCCEMQEIVKCMLVQMSVEKKYKGWSTVVKNVCLWWLVSDLKGDGKKDLEKGYLMVGVMVGCGAEWTLVKDVETGPLVCDGKKRRWAGV